MALERCEFVDRRLRRYPPDRSSAVSYGRAGENALRFPHLAHRSAAVHKLHSTVATSRIDFDSGKGETFSRLGALAYSSRNLSRRPRPLQYVAGIIWRIYVPLLVDDLLAIVDHGCFVTVPRSIWRRVGSPYSSRVTRWNTTRAATTAASMARILRVVLGFIFTLDPPAYFPPDDPVVHWLTLFCQIDPWQQPFRWAAKGVPTDDEGRVPSLQGLRANGGCPFNGCTIQYLLASDGLRH